MACPWRELWPWCGRSNQAPAVALDQLRGRAKSFAASSRSHLRTTHGCIEASMPRHGGKLKRQLGKSDWHQPGDAIENCYRTSACPVPACVEACVRVCVGPFRNLHHNRRNPHHRRRICQPWPSRAPTQRDRYTPTLQYFLRHGTSRQPAQSNG